MLRFARKVFRLRMTTVLADSDRVLGRASGRQPPGCLGAADDIQFKKTGRLTPPRSPEFNLPLPLAWIQFAAPLAKGFFDAYLADGYGRATQRAGVFV